MAQAADDPRQMAAQFELVQREMQRLERRMEALEQALVEAQQARSTLEALQGGGEREVLVPLGSGVHARARLDASAPVLVPVGAGYATEGTVQKAHDALAERIAELTRTFQEANDHAGQLAQVAADLNDRLAGAVPADMV